MYNLEITLLKKSLTNPRTVPPSLSRKSANNVTYQEMLDNKLTKVHIYFISIADCGEVSANRRMRSSPAGMLTVPAASVALISIGAAFAWPFVVAFIPQLRKGDSESVKPWIRHPDTAYVIVRDGRSLSYQASQHAQKFIALYLILFVDYFTITSFRRFIRLGHNFIATCIAVKSQSPND